jgi:hypothetical protein
MRWVTSVAGIVDVKCKQRFRPENLASTDHFGNIRLSYDDNIKLDLKILGYKVINWITWPSIETG